MGCGGGSGTAAVRDSARAYYRALAVRDSAAVCKLSTPRTRRSLAAAARLQRLAAGEAPETAARATCADVRLPGARPLKVAAVRVHGDRAQVRVTGGRPDAGGPFRRERGQWRYDRTMPAGRPFPVVPPLCVESWNDPSNATTQTQTLPRTARLPAAGLLQTLPRGGCRLRVHGSHGDVTFESPPLTGWSETSAGNPNGHGIRFNVRVFEDGLVQPLADVAAGKPRPQAPPSPAAAPAPAPSPWQNCGVIRSPVDHRRLRVEARTFDCRAGRRVAVRFLRNGALPYGWQPSDCAASRAACEQGGYGFRVVK